MVLYLRRPCFHQLNWREHRLLSGEAAQKTIRNLNGIFQAYPVQHTMYPPRPTCPSFPSSAGDFPDPSTSPTCGTLGPNLLLEEEPAHVNIPTSPQPRWAGPPPANYLWLGEMSSHGTSMARSSVGQHVGLSPSTSCLPCPPGLPDHQAQSKPQQG